MRSLSQDNQECLQEHLSRSSTWTQFLSPLGIERCNTIIHQATESQGDSHAVSDVKNFPPAQLPGMPAVPTLFSLLSSSLRSLTQFFSHLLRRQPLETPAQRPYLHPLLPALPAARLLQGHDLERSRHLLLLGAALALSGRPPGFSPLGLAHWVAKPGKEDFSAGQSFPMPSMGSERSEMQKRQTSSVQEPLGSGPGQPGVGSRGSNACCFCWCCCCSCSCLTVRNQRPTGTSHEVRTDFPICEESPTPTLEEVSAWAQSFDNLMITPAGRNAFREFLRTEFSEENMLFWLACEELKKEANKSIIEEKARIIYEDYISILSPKEVSLDSRVREVINRNIGEPSSHIFDDAQLQIYTLMHRDSYPRFMNSTLYKDLLQSLAEKSAEA
ncbi:regulator of G-protein signaling 20 isoform X1 [Dipodomys spectabilis]|uniref:regulator of G-protein signaling 20 isoform X1 n=1 Tax=Dipodomys spectabilis TaxID=105255 RepID=UPI001C534C9F|nr:regulator of G-protein signaling 20 isoform X1 [Dipodomys spectabilis]